MEQYGKEYLPEQPRVYKSKKNAQDGPRGNPSLCAQPDTGTGQGEPDGRSVQAV